jgi:hypothetical protein
MPPSEENGTLAGKVAFITGHALVADGGQTL